MELETYKKTLNPLEQIEFDHFLTDFRKFTYHNRLAKNGTAINNSTIVKIFEEEMRENNESPQDRKLLNLQVTKKLDELINSDPSVLWWSIDNFGDPDNPDCADSVYEIYIRTLDNKYTWIGSMVTHELAELLYKEVYEEQDKRKHGYENFFETNWTNITIVGVKGHSGKITKELIKNGINKFFLLWFNFALENSDINLVFDPAPNFLREAGEDAEFVEDSEGYLEAQFRDILHNRKDYTKEGKRIKLDPENKHKSPVHTLFLEDDERLKIIRLLKAFPHKVDKMHKIKKTRNAEFQIAHDKKRPYGQTFIFDLRITGTRQYYRFIGFNPIQQPEGWIGEFDTEAIGWCFFGKFLPIEL